MKERLSEQCYIPYAVIGLLIPFLIFGIALITWGLLVGWFLTGFCVFMLTLRKGVEINLEKREVNFFMTILGIPSNNWESITRFKSYVVRRKTTYSRSRVSWVNQYHQSETYFIGLIQDNPAKPFVLKTDDKEVLLQLGLVLEKKWGLPRHITKR